MSAEPTSFAPRRAPEAYLRAELAAFPLASEEAFRAGITALDPGLSDPRTAALWRACEERLSQHTGWSLDRLVTARDRLWFGDQAARRGQASSLVTMAGYLRNLAAAHLEPGAGSTRAAEREETPALDAAGHERWLTFSLPEDLLLCALDQDPAPARVTPDAPLLFRRLLDLGVAEIHQHVGAGMDFALLWASALGALATGTVPEDALASPGAPMGGGKLLIRYLLAAAIARSALAEHLFER